MGNGARDGRVGLLAIQRRVLRYCARPPFALERLYAPGGIVSLNSPESRLVYRLPTRGGVPKPASDGRTEILLAPLQLFERLVRFIPPPRVHRHRYPGVLAPNAGRRAAVTCIGRPEAETPAAQHLELPHTPPPISPARGPPQGTKIEVHCVRVIGISSHPLR